MTEIEINPGFNVTTLDRDKRYESKEFREYRMMWDNYPKYDIVQRMPIHLDLELTARCQLKCPGCPSMKLDFDKGDMDWRMANDALSQFATGNYTFYHGRGQSVKFNWRGEPTLHKHLIHLVNNARRYGLVDRMINTNGVSLTPLTSLGLVKAGISMVAFSIDSVDPERYERLRPGAKFWRVMDNLDAFLQEADKEDYLAVRIQRIEYPDEPMPHEEFVEYFKKHYSRINYVASNHYKEKALAGDIARASKPCAQLWQRLVMTYDGWMGPCCEFNRFGEYHFGQYPTMGIDEVWNSEELHNLRALHRECRQNEIKACHTCTVTKPMVRH